MPTLIAAGAAACAPLADALAQLQNSDLALPALVNIQIKEQAADMIARCTDFAGRQMAGTDALIVTIFSPSCGATPGEAANAMAVWGFMRRAALEWAPKRIRVNGLGLGVTPERSFTPPREPAAHPASLAADIVRSLHAMASWRSMTGQFICLAG